MILQPIYPRGGLLGGSSQGGTGKPSKLAALAAARKKAQEEKKRGAETQSAGQDGEQAKPIALLDRLTGKDTAPLAQNTTGDGTKGNGMQPLQRTYPRREKPRPEPEPEPVPEPSPLEQVSTPVPEIPETKAEDVRATPSVFAQTMLGRTAHISQDVTEDNLLPLLYPIDVSQTNNPFAGPSPDDVVVNAQSKGVRH